jgi:hypothetical protein
MSGSIRTWINGSVITLKILALVAILQPVLVRHASKAVTVFEQGLPEAANPPMHARSYTYFSGFHVLNFSDIKWGLAIGLGLYLAALVIQFAAASRVFSTRTQSRQMP